jgi:hypothetical protein
MTSAATAEPISTGRGHTPRTEAILLVEDSRTQLQAMRLSLSTLPIRILTAGSGADGADARVFLQQLSSGGQTRGCLIMLGNAQ